MPGRTVFREPSTGAAIRYRQLAIDREIRAEEHGALAKMHRSLRHPGRWKTCRDCPRLLRQSGE